MPEGTIIAAFIQESGMRVVLVSDLETRGGAAVAASRLAEGLLREGVEVIRLVAEADGQRHPWRTVTEPGRFRRTRCRRLANRVLPDAWVRALMTNDTRARLRQTLRHLQPDILHLHNYHWAFYAAWPLDLPRLCREVAPTVWTLHDQWSLCGVPYPDADHPPHANWHSLFDAARGGGGFPLVTPSVWLGREAAASAWGTSDPVTVIPYGLDCDRFAPMEMEDARCRLGVPPAGLTLLAGAHSLSDPRKGGDLLREALLRCRVPVHLLLFGNGMIEGLPDHVTVHPLGYLADETALRVAYAAADLYIHPARADNLPNTVLEAMACGTPTLGFSIGGMPDMVEEGVSGWLVEGCTGEALGAGLLKLLADPGTLRACRARTRSRACERFALKRQAMAHLELYRDLMESSGARRLLAL